MCMRWYFKSYQRKERDKRNSGKRIRQTTGIKSGKQNNYKERKEIQKLFSEQLTNMYIMNLNNCVECDKIPVSLLKEAVVNSIY